LLLGFVVPTWVAAGFADWACHRATDIEHTSGRKESLIHAAMMTEAGVPALLALFFEVNAGVLATTLASLGCHQATAAWDVAYAEGQREVTPTEQHVHGMLEQVPVMATAFLCALHWDQVRAMFARGEGVARFRLERKRDALPSRYVGGLLAAIAALIVVPYGEELWRCQRAAREREHARATRPATHAPVLAPAIARS
jgi:hypothetical protein